MGFDIANHTLIKREDLDPNHYTLSLLKESYRLGIIDRKTIHGIQEQIMLILKDLIVRYTKGESNSVKTETAEELLNSIYYSIDAYISSFEDVEAGIAILRSAGIKEIYYKGVEIIALTFKEAKQLCQEIVRNKLDVQLEVYNTSVTEALPEFFELYSVVFRAHDTACSLDYPLVFDDMNVRGVFYIKNYLENLETETQFCRLFDKADIKATLAAYGRTCRTDYKESPVNLFELLVNNSIFVVLSGNNAGRLTVSKPQFDMLQKKLNSLHEYEVDSAVSKAIEKVVEDLSIEQPELIAYTYRYKELFLPGLLNAIENNSLQNIIMVSNVENSEAGRIIFKEGNKMYDDIFRHITNRIRESTSVEDKLNAIKLGVGSIEDFVDVLNAECLFGDEYTAVYNTLSDMELAILGRMLIPEEIGDSQLDLSAILADKREIAAEWQEHYISFLQGLSEAKIKSIGRLINTINSW